MATPPVPSRRRRIWPWIVAAVVAPWLCLGAAVWSYVTPMRDLAVVRDHVLLPATGTWQTRVQLDIGGGTLGMARLAARFVQNDEMDEVRAALASVRRVSVGVYERVEDSATGDVATLLGHAEAALLKRGWSRMVKVVDDESTVLVFHTENGSTVSDFCVAVVQVRECILVYARVSANELSQLVALARDQLPFKTYG